MPKFYLTLDLDPNERFVLICLLAQAVMQTRQLYGEDGTTKVDLLSLVRRLLYPSPIAEQSAPSPAERTPATDGGKAAATAVHSPGPVALPPFKNEHGHYTVKVERTEKSLDQKCLLVTCIDNTRTRRRMSCWDQKLWQEIESFTGLARTFEVKESKGFLNIVGIER